MSKFFTDNKGQQWMVTDECKLDDPVANVRAGVRGNLQRKVDALAGRSLKDIFGDEEVPLDVVVVNRWHPDTCGCMISFVWRTDNPQSDHKAHTSHKKCDAHAHIDCVAKGKTDHHEALLTENRGKNHAVGAAAEALGCHPGEVKWKICDKTREVTVSHSLLKDHPEKLAAVKAKLAEKLPGKTCHAE